MTDIYCILMASGRAERFGENKLLVPVDGRPLAEYAFAATRVPEIRCRLLLTIHPKLRELAAMAGINTVLHAFPLRSQAIRLGLKYLQENCISNHSYGVMFMPCDQPGLKSSTVSRLCRTFAADPSCIFRLHEGTRPAAPVIFPAHLVGELMELPDGGRGADVIRRHPELVRECEVSDPLELFDIDTREDLDEFLHRTMNR